MRAVLDQAQLPVTVPGFLAHDPGAVQALLHGRCGPRVYRSLFLRTARQLATELTVRQGSNEPATATGSVPRRRLATLARPR